MNKKKIVVVAIVGALGGAAALASIKSEPAKGGGAAGAAQADAKAKGKPVSMLTVTAVQPEAVDWPVGIAANGSVAAWQEAVVGSELGGLRVAEVKVNVGDPVRRGQLLARLASDSVAAELEQQQGALEEARAALAEASANAKGARELASSGALSAQQTTQYLTLERSAKARVQSAEARVKLEKLHLSQTAVVAADDGIISSRSATLGAVANQGQELFKLIRQNRLEWRAEVTSAELHRVKPGQPVELRTASGATVLGKVRVIGPTSDPSTRNAIVYVDLAPAAQLGAGMFASGRIELGRASALTVPGSALLARDGDSYVFVLGRDGKVAQTKVSVGRRLADRVEIVQGLAAQRQVVVQGAGFLADGDTVSIAAAPAPAAKKLAAASRAATTATR